MQDLYQAISVFHQKFGLDKPETPGDLDHDTFRFRVGFMNEELSEYMLAWENNDIEGMLDALVDLTYVVLGTAYMHGFDFNEAFKRVHEANLKKIRANHSSESKRGSALDVVKPEGWEPPDLSDLV